MGKIYQIYVLGIKGEKMIIDVGQSEEELNNLTILEFKKKLLPKLSAALDATDNLRLVFSTMQLEDSKTFSDYEIKDKSTILVIVRLPGGQLD